MAGFDEVLKAAMNVSREEAQAVVAAERTTKFLSRITPAEQIAFMWAPYMNVQGGYVNEMSPVVPDNHHKVFHRVTKNPKDRTLAKAFADHLTLMQQLMENINTAEVQLANLIKLNGPTTGIVDNAKLLMKKQAVQNSIDTNLKALAKAHNSLVSERHRLAKKLVSASHSTADGRVTFAVDYLTRQLSDNLALIPATDSQLEMTSSEIMRSGIDKLQAFNTAPIAVDQNARMKLDNFVSQLGSMRLTQNEASLPPYQRTVQVTNELRKAFDSELKANAKSLASVEKSLSKSVTKPTPNEFTAKPTAFDVYLDTLSKANKMIALLEKKRDLVKSSAEVVAVTKELNQWQEMRTQLKAAVNNLNNDDSVTFVYQANPKDKNPPPPPPTVLQSIKDMKGDFRKNQQIDAMLKLLATQMDHPNYKNNGAFPLLFAGDTNKNMPENWKQLMEDPKLAEQHVSELSPQKPKAEKPGKAAKATAGVMSPIPPMPERPSANQLIQERDQRNELTLQGTQNNWNTCKAKMDELQVPKAFVNFVKTQFALHLQDVQAFLGDRKNLKNTKLIEAMNHRAQLLTNITATLEHPEVTDIIAVNAIRGLAKTEFNRTPDSPQTAVFKAQLSTFHNSTESIKPAPGSTPGMPKPPTLETPPTLPNATSAPPTPRVSTSTSALFARPKMPTPAPVRDARARYDASDLSSDSEISSSRSDSSSYRSDSSTNSSRSSSSTSSSDSSRRDIDQPPPPSGPPPGPKGPGKRS